MENIPLSVPNEDSQTTIVGGWCTHNSEVLLYILGMWRNSIYHKVSNFHLMGYKNLGPLQQYLV